MKNKKIIAIGLVVIFIVIVCTISLLIVNESEARRFYGTWDYEYTTTDNETYNIRLTFLNNGKCDVDQSCRYGISGIYTINWELTKGKFLHSDNIHITDIYIIDFAPFLRLPTEHNNLKYKDVDKVSCDFSKNDAFFVMTDLNGSKYGFWKVVD